MAARWETQLSIPIHSFLFDAGLFREGRVTFAESLATHEDWDCWIRLIRNKGYLIPAVSIRELLQLYDYRKLLECFTVEKAAQLAAPAIGMMAVEGASQCR
jgi:hypothetical protein